MAEVAADYWGDIAFVALVVGLVLEEDELVALVIGTVVGRVRHNKIIICEKTCQSPQRTTLASFQPIAVSCIVLWAGVCLCDKCVDAMSWILDISAMNYDYLTSTVKVSIPTFSESKT